jgi:hypothetical protein
VYFQPRLKPISFQSDITQEISQLVAEGLPVTIKVWVKVTVTGELELLVTAWNPCESDLQPTLTVMELAFEAAARGTAAAAATAGTDHAAPLRTVRREVPAAWVTGLLSSSMFLALLARRCAPTSDLA